MKEPIGLNYFRFQEEEFALLEMLDGAASLDDLKRQFEDAFAPEQITSTSWASSSACCIAAGW